MTNRNSRAQEESFPSWGRWLVAMAGALVLLLVVISCRTVNRAVVLLPNIPGAKYIGSKECETCHGEKYRDWRAGVHVRRTSDWNGHKKYLLCANCHNPHQPRFQPLAPKPAPQRPTRPGL